MIAELIVSMLCSLFSYTMGYITGFRNADDVEFRKAIKLIKEKIFKKSKEKETNLSDIYQNEYREAEYELLKHDNTNDVNQYLLR